MISRMKRFLLPVLSESRISAPTRREARKIHKGHSVNQDSHRSFPAFIVLSPKDIAVRAYEMYLERGASDGFDSDDWFRAERELKARGKDPDRSEDSE
jgi:Protein of unknown function (DUF2934)